jgi:thymidylate kinase
MKLNITNSIMAKKAPMIVSIEGNIGCGKTTLIENLDTYLNISSIENIKILREPVDIWMTYINSV